MNSLKVLKIAVASFALLLLGAVGFLGATLWRNYWWEREVYGLAGSVGSRQALEDFQHGKLRLRVLYGENDKTRYSGSNDGPFEVWIPQFYPSLGYPHRYSIEQQAAFYNRKMRYMHEHPEKFAAKTNSLRENAKPFTERE